MISLSMLRCQHATPDQRRKDINEAVTKILAKYPAGS
jgi:hypothetical protein